MADYKLSNTGAVVQKVITQVLSWISNKIQTADIADKAITAGKLASALQARIEQIATNQGNIAILQTLQSTDEGNITELTKKMEAVYNVLNDVLNKGVFTAAITASLYGTTAICGKAVCGKAICGNN